MGALDAHNVMSSRALGSETVRDGLRQSFLIMRDSAKPYDRQLNHAHRRRHLHELLRQLMVSLQAPNRSLIAD